MNREELKEIIARVIVRINDEEAPNPACLFGDVEPPPPDCDYTTFYGVGEEG